MRIKASVSVVVFFEVETDVPEGFDPELIGAMAKHVAATTPIKLEATDLPPGFSVRHLVEDDEREHIDWGEVRE